jgi:hypothetical protein
VQGGAPVARASKLDPLGSQVRGDGRPRGQAYDEPLRQHQLGQLVDLVRLELAGKPAPQRTRRAEAADTVLGRERALEESLGIRESREVVEHEVQLEQERRPGIDGESGGVRCRAPATERVAIGARVPPRRPLAGAEPRRGSRARRCRRYGVHSASLGFCGRNVT